MTPEQNQPATAQVLTVGSALGAWASIHIAGMEIDLSLSDAFRISRLLFKAVEEFADRGIMLEMNAKIEAKEDHKAFALEWPVAPLAAVPAPVGLDFTKFLADVEEWEGDDSRGPGDAFDLLMHVLQIIRPEPSTPHSGEAGK